MKLQQSIELLFGWLLCFSFLKTKESLLVVVIHFIILLINNIDDVVDVDVFTVLDNNSIRMINSTTNDNETTILW